MPWDPATTLLLALLAGAVAVDGTSFGQFMISRPLVAATVAGWIVGAPLQGAAIGFVLESFHLTVLPVGAARYPEGGPAAVAGGAVYAASSTPPAGTLLLLVLAVLLLEWMGGESVRFLRQINVRLLAKEGAAGDPHFLQRRHLTAIVLDFARGVLLTLVGIVLLRLWLQGLTPHWGLGEEVSGIIVGGVAIALLASAARLVGWRGWFAAAGVICGIALLLR